MQWIHATTSGGKPVWINMATVRYVHPYANGTTVFFDDTHHIELRETPDQLTAACRIATHQLDMPPGTIAAPM